MQGPFDRLLDIATAGAPWPGQRAQFERDLARTFGARFARDRAVTAQERDRYDRVAASQRAANPRATVPPFRPSRDPNAYMLDAILRDTALAQFDHRTHGQRVVQEARDAAAFRPS